MGRLLQHIREEVRTEMASHAPASTADQLPASTVVATTQQGCAAQQASHQSEHKYLSSSSSSAAASILQQPPLGSYYMLSRLSSIMCGCHVWTICADSVQPSVAMCKYPLCIMATSGCWHSVCTVCVTFANCILSVWVLCNLVSGCMFHVFTGRGCVPIGPTHTFVAQSFCLVGVKLSTAGGVDGGFILGLLFCSFVVVLGCVRCTVGNHHACRLCAVLDDVCAVGTHRARWSGVYCVRCG